MSPLTREDVLDWLSRYVEAWRSYDPGAIAALFADDAEYRYHPYDEPVRGRDAIAASWREEDRRDEPGSWEARYEPVAVDGNVTVATGTSTYLDSQGNAERVFHNNFVMEFDDAGRCLSFTEWYMERPASGAPAA
ncbi:MAG: nuclear transport factor 2 family protein [Actinomycetota bacterium]|nr:nuclear transport factor 2 family protein [Actinomycetota bacterium]